MILCIEFHNSYRSLSVSCFHFISNAFMVVCNFFLIHSKKDKGTFRPKKKMKKHHRAQKLYEMSQATLGTMSMKDAVKLPKGENLDDWLAVSVYDFYNELNCLIAPVLQFCTTETCPEMTAGPNYKYAWQDNNNKKPVMMPASDYIAHVMDWVDSLLNDEKVFPSEQDAQFPKDFIKTIKNIFKRLFRIYAHIYYHHQDEIKVIRVDEPLNSSFRHFMYFTNEFKLIPKDQLAPLQSIIDQIDFS